MNWGILSDDTAMADALLGLRNMLLSNSCTEMGRSVDHAREMEGFTRCGVLWPWDEQRTRARIAGHRNDAMTLLELAAAVERVRTKKVAEYARWCVMVRGLSDLAIPSDMVSPETFAHYLYGHGCDEAARDIDKAWATVQHDHIADELLEDRAAFADAETDDN